MRPKRPWFALLIALVPGLVWAAGEVAVSTDQLIYDGGDITVVVVNNTRSPIMFPGCGAAYLERFTGEGFEAMQVPECEGEPPPVALKRGEERRIVLTPNVETREILRPVATFATGCKSGVPLPQAECRNFESARARYVSWGPQPAAQP